jgi:hypothetical protein
MIRILVGAPANTGLFPYKIDGHWGPGGAPLVGIAEDPVGEACRVLEALGVDPRTRVEVIEPWGGLRTVLGALMKTLPAPQKALPPPRRARRKALIAKSSGIPGDG